MESILLSTEKFSSLHYLRYGQGFPIVLIHGFPESGTLWNNLGKMLAEHFTLIVPDLPGAGSSRTTSEHLSMEDMAEVIAAILQREGFPGAVIAGHSMGGYVALAMAALYPHLIKGLSLVHSTAKADSEEKIQTRLKSIQLIRKGGKEAFVKGMIPNLFSEQFRQRNPDVIAEQIDRAMDMDGDSMISFYNAMIKRADHTNSLMKLPFPVQWIVGAKDALIPLKDALAQCHGADVNFVSLYEDCGHMSMLEAPDALANDLAVFADYCYNR